MNIRISNAGSNSYCHSSEVVKVKFLNHWQGVCLDIEGTGFHWNTSKRHAQLIFKEPDDIELLIQQLKKAQAELNIKLLERDAA